MGQKALGIIETVGLNTAIVAADAAVKAANVELLGYENSRGGGLITIKLVGDVGAVKAAVDAAAASIKMNGQGGRIVSAEVIARPHDQIEPHIKEITRGKGKKADVKPAPVPAPVPKVVAPEPSAPAPQPKADPELELKEEAPAAKTETPRPAPSGKPGDKPKGKK